MESIHRQLLTFRISSSRLNLTLRVVYSVFEPILLIDNVGS